MRDGVGDDGLKGRENASMNGPNDGLQGGRKGGRQHPALDRLSLTGLRFWGYTGVFPREQEAGQLFEVDVDLYLDLDRAARTDDLAATVDYGRVFDAVRRTVEEGRFKLIEALAGAVADLVLKETKVSEVAVRVRKPEAPLPGAFEAAEVELRRSRGWSVAGAPDAAGGSDEADRADGADRPNKADGADRVNRAGERR